MNKKISIIKKLIITFAGVIMGLTSLTAFSQNTIRVNNGKIYSSCNEEIVMRGYNEMFIWSQDRKGEVLLPEMAKTGANAVRLVWTTQGNEAELDALIGNSIKNKMIPVPELHDATGDFSKLQQLVDYWKRPAVLKIVQKYKKWVIVNIGNEVGGGSETVAQWVAFYKDAITQLRDAGIDTPLMIDCGSYGNEERYFLEGGEELLKFDPKQNLIFGIHTYWQNAGDAAKLQRLERMISTAKTKKLPYVIGEGPQLAASPSNCSDIFPYKQLLKRTQEEGIGWLAWSWGAVDNSDCGAPNSVFDVTSDGKFGNWATTFAREISISDANSIKNTSVIPPSMANPSTACNNGGADTPTPPTSQQAYPNGTPSPIPGTIESENFDTGGQGIAYNDNNAANNGKEYRPNEGVDLGIASGGGYQVGWTVAGEWQEYTVNVASAGNYNTAIVHAGGNNSTGAIRIEFNGADKTGAISLPPTGGWNTFQTVNKAVSLNAGQQVMRVYTITAGFNLNKIIFTQSNTNNPGNGNSDSNAFFVVNRQTGKKLAVPNSNDGVQLIQVDASSTSNNAKWTQVNTSNGFFYLKNVASGKYFRPASATDGSKIEQRPTSYTGSWTQWEKINTSGGYFYLKNLNTKKYFRPSGNTNNDGMDLRPTSYSGNYTQWTFQNTSAKSIRAEIGIKIITNPINNGTIELSGANGASYSINSLEGKIGATGIINTNSIDVSSLTSGLYIILFQKEGKTQFEKIVIE